MSDLKKTIESDMQIQKLSREILNLKALIDSTRSLYDALDKKTLELQALVGDCEVPVTTIEYLETLDGNVIQSGPSFVKVVDNFKDKNHVFKSAVVRRYECIVESQAERQLKELRKSKND
ncbi:MAG TPA: hypothetical protein PKI14_01600 [Fervidobacterium sp.]|nr:hypothetical protein [Fervidobacterium sp.]